MTLSISYLLLGSNMGNRFALLAAACEHIAEKLGDIVAQSHLYETAAWGNTAQAAFLNQAIALVTPLNPHDLLTAIHQIEQQMGRVRQQRWDSRIIDIDILAYEQLIVDSPNLSIPHPLLPQRRFALLPLCDIAPQWQHPILQQTTLQMLQNCSDNLWCNRADADIR